MPVEATIILAGKGVFIFLLLFFASWKDLRSRIVPNTYSVILATLAWIPPEQGKAFGVFCAIPFLVAAVTTGGIGGADIKIMGAAGMLLGLYDGLAAMAIGLSCMLLFHRIKCRKHQKRDQAYPLIPFLSFGILLMYGIQFVQAVR